MSYMFKKGTYILLLRAISRIINLDLDLDLDIDKDIDKDIDIDNYFAEVEQLAFAPSHMVPGIEPSPDKMLQVHRHRHNGLKYVPQPYTRRCITYFTPRHKCKHKAWVHPLDLSQPGAARLN